LNRYNYTKPNQSLFISYFEPDKIPLESLSAGFLKLGNSVSGICGNLMLQDYKSDAKPVQLLGILSNNLYLDAFRSLLAFFLLFSALIHTWLASFQSFRQRFHSGRVN